MLCTSGIFSERSFCAREQMSTERCLVEPSGSSSDMKTTRWSSSGRNDVCVDVNIETVRSIVRMRSIIARKMRLASHFAMRTKKPLNALMAQLNHAKGPCLNGRASCSKSEQSAGASVRAHTVEKHTAAESVTENCW